MKDLSVFEKYSMDEIAKELNLSKRLSNQIKKHFGEVMSLNDLSQITRNEFCQYAGLGSKSWHQFTDALSHFEFPNETVNLIDRPSRNKIVVEIDISKSFGDVIYELSKII